MKITIRTDAISATYHDIESLEAAIKQFSREEGFSAETAQELREEVEADGGWVHFFDEKGNLGL